MNETRLKRTPLFDEHVAAGGKIVPFGGFEMPVQYASIIEEHTAVRTRAGLFDVSHMGEILIHGPRALNFVQKISCNDHAKMAVGRAQYTGLMYPEGTFVDDMLVHKMADDEYFLVVNAANTDKDFAYIQEVAAGEHGVEVVNQSADYAQLALQGPLALEVLQPLTQTDLGAIRYYRFTWGEVLGHRAIIARTGYTGEDGFEVYVAPGHAVEIWRAILAEGGPKGVIPAGLGARDTLRLEAGMCLYGNDIDRTATPLEAGLAWIVKLDKGDFIGRDVLERQAREGIDRKLVGFEMVDRGIARHGFPVFLNPNDEEAAGVVTSGTHSPTLRKPIGMAYVPSEAAVDGREIWISIRGQLRKAAIVPLPFYSRKRKKKA
ncbi:MAG: glycine cleavage system aminomethyltransferase GcvT [Nitrospiraceae bacterium]|nr:glycine cleavage system aminomethyltransferase GcvT [Nitrospiraceae bacterium]